jgi:hypothetical protein
MKPQTQYLTEPAGSANSNENANSPISDFVLIDSTTDYQPSPSPRPSKRKASEVEESASFGTVFVQHTFSHDHSSHAHQENDFARKRINSNRVGGRATGSHLNAQSAARARELREKGSCWICCLQRDSVSFENRSILLSINLTLLDSAHQAKLVTAALKETSVPKWSKALRWGAIEPS